MIGRIEFNNMFGFQRPEQMHQNNSQSTQTGFQGIQQTTPAQKNSQGGIQPGFFGPPNPADRMQDMKMCRQLGIDSAGMQREDIKANILSRLTGQPVDQMRAFYSNVGEMDMRKDFQALKAMGIFPSQNPNNMMARAENKANIVNNWMQTSNNPQVEEQQNQNQSQASQAAQGNQKEGNGGPQGPPPLPAAILAIMNAVGVNPTGSKDSDYASVMSRISTMMDQTTDIGQKQYYDTLKTTFMSAFAAL